VYPHFEQHTSASSAALPDVSIMEAMIDTAFWASLRREEGFIPAISLAYVAPDQVPVALRLERPLPFAPQWLTRLSPAVERPGVHLGVWRENGELTVWGATRKLPPFSFVLEVIAPGLLVVKHSPTEGSGKFTNVAVFEGDQIKIINPNPGPLENCPDVLFSLLGLESDSEENPGEDVWIRIAASMRRHGRGGSLLVVPSGSQEWRESILHPVMYAIEPPFAALSDLLHKDVEERQLTRWQEALTRAIDAVAGLTAVDGATIITDQFELLAFGAKIVRRRGLAQVNRIVVSEPVEGVEPVQVEPSAIGGTRHLSAAQFTHDQRNSIAMVASQDRRFTVFGWSPCEETVLAHRIDALLM
jgi:hypothetical protein